MIIGNYVSNVNIITIVASSILFYKFNMKKAGLIGVRVPEDIKDIIQRLADEDERTLSYVARKLIFEALERRGLIAREPSDKSEKRLKK